MAFLSWRNEYRVGVEQIDEEHRYLFDLINAFHDTHVGGTNRSALGQILNRLVHYAEQHFRHEEAIMKAEAYPAYVEHCALHEDLYLTIFRLSEKLAAGSLRVDMETVRFIRSWLVTHIVQHDLQFSDYVARRPKPAAPDET